MEPTSNPTPQVVNRFFTVAQILAFNQPPMPEALKKVSVGGGSEAEYLEGEYIRLALNMLVGQGMWELKTKVVHQDVRTIKKTIFENRRPKGTEDWLGVSAVIHTQLIISARDGSDAKLVYEANAVGDGMSHPDKGISSALDLAIKSAETDTLKRCSQNLGRAFGLDLKNKVTKKMLPLTVKHFEERLAARHAAMVGANDQGVQTIEHAPAAALEDHSKAQSDAPAPAATPAPSADRVPVAEEQPKLGEPAREQAKSTPSRSEDAARPKTTPERNQRAPSARPEPEAAARNESRSDQSVNRDNENKAEPASQPQSGNDPVNYEPWELSLIPSEFTEWDRCIRTMASRVAKMTLENELENFIRRHENIIKKFPIIAATDDVQEKNFPRRWEYIVERRRDAIKKAKAAAAEDKQAA